MPLSRIHVFVGKNKLHAKVFVFDKEIGVVGTYNMDPMSEELNSEVVAAVHSTIFAGQVRDSIMKDIAVSDEYKVEVLADGTVRTIKGPSDITPKKTMVILNLLRKFKILKPII
jgi:phosphatidylserine/phosphatidylglycerophosphate/cardiolipin synthase-like enzyme